MLSRLRISRRLPLSFAVVCGLLIAVVATGYVALTDAGALLTRYSRIASNTQQMLELEADFLDARRNVIRLSNGEADAREALDRGFAAARRHIGELRRNLILEERRRKVQEIERLIAEYEAGARRVGELRSERDALVRETLDPVGIRLRAVLLETNGATVVGRPDVDRYVTALDTLLWTRLVAFRVIAGSLDDAARVLTLADATRTAFTALRDSRNGAERDGAERLLADLSAYRRGLERFRDVLAETNTLVGSQMPQLGTRLAGMIEQLVSEQSASLGAIRDEATAVAQIGTRTMLAVGGGALALAALLAVLLARGITGPLGQLAAAMRRLADGDTTGTVPGLDRKDELRAMSQALAVFQDNAKALQQAEADKKREEARVAAERQRMMQELGAAVGSVVDAASHGDFSRRVEARFDDEELTRLGQGLNRLVGTVQESLDDLMQVLEALGAGDLTTRVARQYEGAFAAIASGTNGTAEKLAAVIGRIGEATETLDSASREILSGANDLAQRTSHQAAMVEETAAAVEEFGATVQTNASRASRASELAASAETRAQEGGTVMREAQAAMGRIDEASARISEVVGLIENIAFQTNLLALNASVEAARAGEAGRGFAVVASEVRRLAQHASQASTEVKALISTSVTEVRSGVDLVTRAGDSLQAIVGAINEVTGLMVEIAGVSKEQAITINEIGSAVRKLDEMTQQNAALVEETNSAIHMTEQQVNALNGTVGEFRLAGSGRRSMRSAA